MWHLLDQADIVIAHNGDNFDMPNLNTRFLFHGFPPPSYYKTIDTFKVAKAQFGFTHNNLDGIAKFLGIPGKSKTDFQLWKACMFGDEEALAYMLEYNKQDVIVEEAVYLKLRPYIRNHPNYNLYIDSENPVCPTCGGTHLTHVGYYYYTPTGKYKDYRCDTCGALSRERKSVLENKKTILVSNGR
jgi:DNA polymerase III epsilon subunit-like protein